MPCCSSSDVMHLFLSLHGFLSYDHSSPYLSGPLLMGLCCLQSSSSLLLSFPLPLLSSPSLPSLLPCLPPPQLYHYADIGTCGHWRAHSRAHCWNRSYASLRLCHTASHQCPKESCQLTHLVHQLVHHLSSGMCVLVSGHPLFRVGTPRRQGAHLPCSALHPGTSAWAWFTAPRTKLSRSHRCIPEVSHSPGRHCQILHLLHAPAQE